MSETLMPTQFENNYEDENQITVNSLIDSIGSENGENNVLETNPTILPSADLEDAEESCIDESMEEVTQSDLDKDNVYIDENGERWLIRKSLADNLGTHPNTLKRFLSNVTHIIGKSVQGKNRTLYRESEVLANEDLQNFLSLPVIDRDNNAYIDEHGDRWVTKEHLATITGITSGGLKKFEGNISTCYGRGLSHFEIILYREKDLLENPEVQKFLALPQIDPVSDSFFDGQKKWVTKKQLARQLGIDEKALSVYLQSCSRRSGRKVGREIDLYIESEVLSNPSLRANISLPQVNPDTNTYTDSDGVVWLSRNELRKLLGISYQSLDRFTTTTPSIQGKSSSGRVTTLFQLDAVFDNQELIDFLSRKEERKENAGKYPKRNRDKVEEINIPQIDKEQKAYVENGERWVTHNHLKKTLGIAHVTLGRYLTDIPSRKGKTNNGSDVTLYRESDVLAHEELRRFLALPMIDEEASCYIDEDGNIWMSRYQLAKKYGIPPDWIYDTTFNLITKQVRIKNGREITAYNEIEVLQALQIKSDKLKNVDNTSEGNHNFQLKNDFENAVRDMSQDITPDSQRFREILNIFGGAYAVDILFLHHPEFRDLPIDYVESVIGEYLGDYIKVSRRPLRLEDLGKAVEYLSDQNIREALYEVIKGSCLTHFNANRVKDADEIDSEIIDRFLIDVYQKMSEVQSPELEEVVDRVRVYFEELLHDYEKPGQFVDSLKPDRPFPDINQLVNIKELHDKNKLLIADEMGLGKSASVIMAHEMYGKGTALIVAPSNVVSTWEGYLSDSRKRKGYFREGQAPRTLIIDEPQSLEGVDLSTYDYVIISQEKLNNGYVDILEQQRFGTLIVDEIHKLKNITDGKRAKNLIRLAKGIRDPDQYLALLSGTPVPNKVQDIAMILRLLYPEEYQDVSDRALVYSIIQGKLINLRSKLLPRMQRKSLKEGVNLPELQREQISVPLSELEQHIYEVLLEEDELTIQEKLKVLRLFLLNPEMLDSTPGIESSKADYVAEELRKDFQEHKKIVMFVNGYIEGVLRGDTTIIPQLGLPDDVEVRIIDGSLDQDKRQPLIDEIKASSGKVLLLVSGQTADVGVDFSFADGVYFYNEPWTQYDKNQQESRVFREGVQHDIVSKTFVVDGTIEEGINLYIQAKERAIEKLLEGIPLSELEKELVQRDERQTESNLEVNPELAAYYFSTWEKMKKIFAHVREIGEEEFRKFLDRYGYDYATGYKEMGRRSYQSNASRVSAAFIERMVDASETSAQGISILDIASGPEMLRRHISDCLASNVFSLDINPHHFTESSDDMHRVGSFLSMPFDDESFDFANFALAFHYTDFIPRKGKLDRLQSLMEANRVLRKGGRLVLNNLNSLDIKNMEQFEAIVGLLGFTVVEEYTGIVQSGNNFRSHVITLEKCEYFPAELEVIIEAIGKENYNGLRFAKNSSVLKDTRRIITSFEFRGTTVELGLNSVDRELLLEEKQAMNEGAELKSNYGGIGGIPSEEVIKNGFIRILIGEKYILFKKLKKGSGVILIK